MGQGQLFQIGGALVIVFFGWFLLAKNQSTLPEKVPIPKAITFETSLADLSPTLAPTIITETRSTITVKPTQITNKNSTDCPELLVLNGTYTCHTNRTPENVFDWFVSELEKNGYKSLSKVRVKTNGEYNYKISATKDNSISIEIKKQPDDDKTRIQVN